MLAHRGGLQTARKSCLMQAEGEARVFTPSACGAGRRDCSRKTNLKIAARVGRVTANGFTLHPAVMASGRCGRFLQPVELQSKLPRKEDTLLWSRSTGN